MKKISIFFVLSFALILASCTNNSYTIRGDFSDNNFDGETIYLQTIDTVSWSSYTVIDSTVIKNSKFEFKGKLAVNPMAGFISIGNLNNPATMSNLESPIATIVLEPGDITVKFEKTAVIVGGTEKNVAMNKINELVNQMAALNNSALIDDSIMAKKESIIKAVQDTTFAFTKANIKNKMGEYMLISSIQYFTAQQNIELLSETDSNFQKKPEVEHLAKMFQQIIAQEEASAKMESELLNKSFIDAKLMNRQGEQVNLSSFVGKGKYVLIDFWASWCGPCIQEIPTLIEAHRMYKDKGFDIVGISIDEDLSAWHKTIEAKGMTWTHLSDADNSVAQLYKVPGIPCTLLTDKDGTIIAMNLRGSELLEKLNELIK